MKRLSFTIGLSLGLTLFTACERAQKIKAVVEPAKAQTTNAVVPGTATGGVAELRAPEALKTNTPIVLPDAAKATSSLGFSDPAKLTEKAPDTFKAQFDTTKGKFTIEATRSLSPNGADRFYNLVKSGYFQDVAFFRVIPGFMAQFGLHGDPAVAAKWREARIGDDPVQGSNTRGTICFAMAGPNTRTTQFFINFVDNQNLDGMGFSPFGKVAEGLDVVDKINGEYGEGAPRGRGPDQGRVQTQGNAYLKKDFPNLDYIKSATILPAGESK